MKKITLLFSLLIVTSLAFGESHTFAFNKMDYSSGADLTSEIMKSTDEKLEISFAQNDAGIATKFYSGIRCYQISGSGTKGGGLTITASSNTTITGVTAKLSRGESAFRYDIGSGEEDFSSLAVSELSASSFECYGVGTASSTRIYLDTLIVEYSVVTVAGVPVISNILPANDFTTKLGDAFTLSADVTVEGATIDSVLLFHGEDVVNDSMKLDKGTDDSYAIEFPQGVDDDGTFVWYIKAFASNGEVSETIQYNLIAECNDVVAPVAGAASSVTASSFTASWSDESADKYVLNVWSEVGTPTVELASTGFEDGMPTGWSNNSAYFNGGSQYEGSSKAGMNGVGDWVKLSAVDNPTTLSLWHTPSSAGDEPYTIEVQYSTNDTDWTTLTSFSHANNDDYVEETIDLNSISTTGLIIRLYMTAKSKSFYFDNVKVTSGGLTVTPFLTDQEVAATSYDVTGLTSGTEYKYTVTAVDQYGCVSAVSNEIAVTPSTSTALEMEISAAKVYGVRGAINVYNVNFADVMIYDISGRQVATQKVNNEASIAISSGIYLVRVADTVTKVAVQ